MSEPTAGRAGPTTPAGAIHDIGYLLWETVYDDIPRVPPDPHEEEETDVVRDFDPMRHPPGAFEKAFGNAYYE